MYCIYKTTNELNNKIYVGQADMTKEDFKYYLGSGTKLINSIKKHSRKNFKRELIDFSLTRTGIDKKEIYWIEKLKPHYNILPGGKGTPSGKQHPSFGRKHSNETKHKMSLFQSKPRPQMIGRVSPFKNKKHSEETKKKISETIKNK